MNVFDQYTGGSSRKENWAAGQTVALAGADHADSLRSIMIMHRQWGAKALLFGDRDAIIKTADSIGFELDRNWIVDVAQREQTCTEAAAAVASGDASVLMKGFVHTSDFSRAFLRRETRLVPEGGLISHLALFELTFYHKPLFVTDSAINIEPDAEKKIRIITECAQVMRSLGLEHQKVAMLAPVEEVTRRIQSTLDAAAVAARQREEGFSPTARIDGPFAMDVVLSRHAAELKGIDSDVAGDADLVVCPNLDTGNAVNKLLTMAPGSRSAGIIVGLRVPVVLTSRSDSDRTRLHSLGMALSHAVC